MDLLAKLSPFLKSHTRSLVTGLIGMAIFTGFSLLPPLFIRSLVNDVVSPGAWDLLLPLVGAIILVPIISKILQFGNAWIISKSGYKMIREIRMAIYDRIFELSMKFHEANSAGLLVNRLMSDVNALLQLVTGATFNLFIDFLVFAFSVSIVASLSPILGVILVVIVVLYVVFYRHFAKRIRRSTTTFRRYFDEISERLEETTQGVRHVRIFNREPWENDLFLDRTNESLKYAMSSRLNSVSLNTVCTFIAGFGSAAIAVMGAYFVLRGRLLYGDVVAINTYIWMALTPAIRFTTIAAKLSETLVSVRRLWEILDSDLRIVSAPGAPPLRRGAGSVEFDNVHFSYVPDVPLFQGLSLSVKPGMSVALVGQTGCGKTTLTSLLMRHWDIQGGSIRIDGVETRDVELESLRRTFGVVLQDPVVFDGTLRENIAYGLRNVTDEQVEEAARIAEIQELVRGLPEGFDSMIGTNGVRLSVGEKQRISIARAIIKDPVILIMDEATSSLDSESEALIQKALGTILHQRTSFIVAHRLSTITSVDMIVVMDSGAIVEQGTHKELMRLKGGRYRRLFDELRGSVASEGSR